MTEITVTQLANVVGVPVERLLQQLNEAGLKIIKADELVSEEQKRQLLSFLQRSHGEVNNTNSTKKITLNRKSVSTIKLGGDARHGKTVNVEVRKKRTYVKRDKEQEAKEAAEREAAEKAAAELARQKVIAEKAEQEKLAAEHPELGHDIEQVVVDIVSEQPVVVVIEEPEAPKKTEVKEKHPRKRDIEAEITAARDRDNGWRESGEGAKAKPSEKKLKGKRKIRMAQRTSKHAEHEIKKHVFEKPTAPVVHDVVIPETITVADLAKKMSVKAAEVIKVMMNMGAMATINQVIDQDTAVIVVEEMGHKPKLLKVNAVEEALRQELESSGEKIGRAPVVTIMGHVDHGKTSLLDYIRRTRVAAGEAGGITQHIGAYHVDTDKGTITFLDTPGHAAFTRMRARGVHATDIVILIVAADDGVKPQTIEAIQHAKAGNVPIIVAVNKIDKPDADPEKVKTELTQHGVISEQWGGDTMFVNISAKTGDGINDLLDAILLVAEVLELKAVSDGPAKGVVIESRLDKGRGPVATVLVQSGLLRKGEILLAGLQYGRIRAILNDTGHLVEKAGPSMPVEVLGLSGVPSAGDEAVVVSDERKAREVALFRQGKYRDVKLARSQQASLEGLFDNLNTGEQKTLNILLKADVQGSVEAISEALVKLSSKDVKVEVVGSGVGGITESDINLAVASKAVVIGFNVRADATAKRLVEQENVDLHYYSVIYDVVDDVKKAILGMLAPEFKETIVGVAQVRDVFRSPKIGAIAGCMVIEGTIKRNNPIRVLRENVVIYEGTLESLRRFKDDVLDVRQGTECGIGVKNYNDVKPGDLIEVYETVEIKRQLA